MAQADIGIDVTTFVVRAAPRQPVHHALNARPVWRCTIKPDFTAYATHFSTGTRDEGLARISHRMDEPSLDL